MISIVCPVYNEEKYIMELLQFYASVGCIDKELYLIDGGSIDRTRTIIQEFAAQDPTVHLLDNPMKYVPFALNLAVPKCKGDIVIRLDAHTHYSPNYISQILEVFKTTDADIVGGPMRAVGYAPFQRAVAYATSTRFGVGNSQFHFKNFRGYTDSVYLGAWRKRVFEKIGLFDERLRRNQDDEFHYRARGAGLKIFQDPSIESTYFPRDNPKQLFIQYFQYGLYKPLVLRKVQSEAKIRHFVPTGLVAYLLSLPFMLLVTPLAGVPLALYLALLIFYSFKGNLSLKEKVNCLMVFPILHVSYGLGFLRGTIRPPGEKEKL